MYLYIYIYIKRKIQKHFGQCLYIYIYKIGCSVGTMALFLSHSTDLVHCVRAMFVHIPSDRPMDLMYCDICGINMHLEHIYIYIHIYEKHKLEK